MNKQKAMTIRMRMGNVEDFLKRVKHVMRTADKGMAIKPSHAVIFEDPAEMLRLIRCIRQNPSSIFTNFKI